MIRGSSPRQVFVDPIVLAEHLGARSAGAELGDHRIVDGREAVTFLKHIKDLIEDPARILVEV